MKLRNFGLLMLGISLSSPCFSQRIVNQTSIDSEASVFLFAPQSLYAFGQSVAAGELFPDFETISTDNEVVSLDDIFQASISTERVPVIVFGRPSCNFMRSAYENLILPINSTNGSDFSIYHIAPSIEAHPTNGYESPYYTINQGDTVSGNVVIPGNIGFEFLQPFSGEELVARTAEFIDKMVEVQVRTEDDFEDVQILLDDVAGGFTQAFKGPAIVWVLNPFSGKVEYERTSFGCYYNPITGCQAERNELLNAIAEVKALYQLVNVNSPENPEQWIELTGFNLLGQNLETGMRLFYNPVAKIKQIRLAQ